MVTTHQFTNKVFVYFKTVIEFKPIDNDFINQGRKGHQAYTYKT